MRIARATLLTALASCFALVVVVASAQAAPVINGGFESGTLEGWQTAYLNHEEGQAGWPVLSGTETPLSKSAVLAPFEGAFDAVADQQSPSSLALYQDVALPAGETHQLSLELNYRSYEPIAIPNPDTLEVTGQAGEPPNQQVRVDVMKAGSSPFSLAPEDTLATLFTTKDGDPEEIGWTHLTADLSAYAGQTVEIRVAVAANRLFLNAGVDAVRIDSTPIPVAPVTPPSTPAAATPAAAAAAPAHAPVCTVPNLKGLKLTDARTALRAAGCGLGEGKVRRKRGVRSKDGKVVKQWPQPGALRAAGAISAVKLG